VNYCVFVVVYWTRRVDLTVICSSESTPIFCSSSVYTSSAPSSWSILNQWHHHLTSDLVRPATYYCPHHIHAGSRCSF